MKIEPYLFFDGNAEEALAFYAQALNAKLEAKLRYADCPDPVPPECIPPGGRQKIMHACLLIDGQRLMMSDGTPQEAGAFRGFCLSLEYPTEAEARNIFGRLADGGRILMPMGPTFFSPCFGMLSDRFGVQWMVMILDEEKCQA